MEIAFDPAKDEINQRKHGMSLSDAALMEMDDATISSDTRFDYGESRFRAWGFIHGVLHVMAFTGRGDRLADFSTKSQREGEQAPCQRPVPTLTMTCRSTMTKTPN
jgi:uncharacterized DUF497 family protein